MFWEIEKIHTIRTYTLIIKHLLTRTVIGAVVVSTSFALSTD